MQNNIDDISLTPGPQGPAGADGAPGSDGADGPPGSPGADGADSIVDTRSPDVDDDMNDGHSVGALWIDTSGGEAYIMKDNTAGSAVWKQITDSPSPTYNIGDTGPAGGIVFYVTELGSHGLEAAPVDQSIPNLASWGCNLTDIVGAEGTATGTGAQNTVDILAGCPERPMAASVAADYPGPNGDSLGEWFLPSKDELNELYLNRVVAGDFPNGLYWSSSEVGDCAAWYQFFFNGFQGNGPKFDTFGVRAIRIF